MAFAPDTIVTPQQYRAMLERFDFTYEYSDDPRVWREGNAAYAALRPIQEALDPDREIWNEVYSRRYR
jgi:hypothetical protein